MTRLTFVAISALAVAGLGLGGCVATVVGTAVGTTAAVAGAAVSTTGKVAVGTVKVTGKAVGAAVPDGKRKRDRDRDDR